MVHLIVGAELPAAPVDVVTSLTTLGSRVNAIPPPIGAVHLFTTVAVAVTPTLPLAYTNPAMAMTITATAVVTKNFFIISSFFCLRDRTRPGFFGQERCRLSPGLNKPFKKSFN